MPEPIDWMPEARQLAAQCWTDLETEKIEMNTALAEAVAKRIAAWMETAAQAARGQEFYRGLVVKAGDHFGVAARTSDDGSVQDHVLALKVPELVEAVVKEAADLKTRLDYIHGIVCEKSNDGRDLELGSTAFKSVQRWANWRDHPTIKSE
jgi:hypothetical protein